MKHKWATRHIQVNCGQGKPSPCLLGRERHQEARFRTGHTRGHPGWKQRMEGNAEAEGGNLESVRITEAVMGWASIL